jgi:single-strand DNA-binding protein
MRCLNKVMLIGNAAKDPELRYTPQGTAVCSFTIATNREWKDGSGQKKEEATFHRVIAWSKLGEIISQYLVKGSKVYLEGRLSSRSWKDQQGVTHNITEVIADELILLDNKKAGVQPSQVQPQEEQPPEPEPSDDPEPTMKGKEETVDPEDIPF